MWTKFMDMYSGGGQKEKWQYIYIEAPEKEAKVIFYNRFGHNPERVTCTCCGSDYSIMEHKTLEEATVYERNNLGGKCMTVDKYIKTEDVLVIYKEEIAPEERMGMVPVQGYVWK